MPLINPPPPINPQHLDGALALVALALNAEAVGERLQKIAEVQAAADAALAELREKEPDLAQREKAVAERSAEVARRADANEQRAVALTRKQNEFDDFRTAESKRLAEHESSLDARERTVAEKESAIAAARARLQATLGS